MKILITLAFLLKAFWMITRSAVAYFISLDKKVKEVSVSGKETKIVKYDKFK